MTTKIRELVSKNKRRYVGNGFDLDLSCILYRTLSANGSPGNTKCYWLPAAGIHSPLDLLEDIFLSV